MLDTSLFSKLCSVNIYSQHAPYFSFSSWYLLEETLNCWWKLIPPLSIAFTIVLGDLSRDYIPTPSQKDIHLRYFVKISSFAFSFYIRNAALINFCIQSEVYFGVHENHIVPAPFIGKTLSVWLWCLGWKSVVCSSAGPSPCSRFCSPPVCQYRCRFYRVLTTVSHGEPWR